MLFQTSAPVARVITSAQGWHGWLFKLRFVTARAELALAKGDASEALRLAQKAGEQARACGRVKYQSATALIRGNAQLALGRHDDGVAELHAALAAARRLDDPAMIARVTASLSRVIEGADARGAVERIVAGLPPAQRAAFELAARAHGIIA